MSDTEQLQKRIDELEKELAEMRAEQKQIGFQLRSSLVPMKGFVRTLIDDENEEWYTREDRREFYTIIDDNVDRQCRLIDLLYVPLTKHDGSLVMEWEKDVDVREILERVITRKQLYTRRHQFVLDFEPERIAIETDYKQFAVIFDNLIDNAIRYTPGGGHIKITVWLETSNKIDMKENLRVEINIGIGLSKVQLKAVEGKLIRIPYPAPAPAPPTGLGLVLALVKQHYGTIEYDSESIDKGVTVRVRLPLRQIKEA